MIVFNHGNVLVAVGEVFIVIEVAVVAWNTVVVAHIYGLGHFFTSHEGLVEFLSVACADDLDLSLSICRIHLGIYLFEGFGQCLE